MAASASLTPHDVHYGLADQRVAARGYVLGSAHAAYPERFPAGVPTPPPPPTAVWINPPTLTSTNAEKTH
jgi:putative transposase